MNRSLQVQLLLIAILVVVTACGNRHSTSAPSRPPTNAQLQPATSAPVQQSSHNGSLQQRLGGRLTCDCPGQISEIDLDTGTITPKFKGLQPYQSENGETAFMSSDYKVMIGSADGQDFEQFHELENKTFSSLVPAVLSPDGSKVAFYDSYTTVRDRRTGQELAAIDGYFAEQWTRDGRLLLTGWSDNEGIYLTNRELTQIQRIDPDIPGEHPRISPDGRRVALRWQDHIWVFNVDGSDPIRVTASNSGDEWKPTWSPDGKYLIVTYGDTFTYTTCGGCGYAFIVSAERLNQMPNSNDLDFVTERGANVAKCAEGIKVPCLITDASGNAISTERIVAWH